MRLGRSYAQSRLGRPVVVFAPPAPTQRQQTITTAFAASTRTRADLKRRFPLQGFDGTLQLRTGNATEFDRNAPGATSPLLGPRPPKVVGRVPDLRRQTVRVYVQPVLYRRVTEVRRFPLQGWSGALTRVSTLSDGGTQTLPLRKPLLGPRPPAVVTPLPTQRQQTIRVAFAIPVGHVSDGYQRRAPRSELRAPIISAAAPFVAPPLAINLLPVDRIGRRHRRHNLTSFLNGPTVLQTFSGPEALTVAVATRADRQRRRLPGSLLVPPAVVEPSLRPPDRRLEIPTTLATIRPRPTVRFLGEPTALEVFPGPSVTVTRTRPRPTATLLGTPATVRVPAVEQDERTTRVLLTRTRPHRTVGTRLQPPSVVIVPSVAQAEDTIRVALVRIRPRTTVRELGAPTALLVFAGPVAPRVRTRPRPTAARLLPPAVIEPSLRLPDRRLRIPTALTRTRPAHTLGTRLAPPTVVTTAAVAAFHGPAVALTRTRPRPTRRLLAPPTTLQTFTGARVALVRTRPRPTTRLLARPAALLVFAGPDEVEVAVRTPVEDRRRAPRSRLRPPAVVLVPSVEQQLRTPRVGLVRTRPRRTQGTRLGTPTVVLVPSVEQAERTLAVALARTRPRHTVGTRLAPPAVLQVFAGATVVLVRARPRRTLARLLAPTVLETFAAAAITVVRTRPRPTVRYLAPPTALRVPAVEQSEQTIRAALVRARPRPTTRILGAPAALQVFPGPTVALARTRPRPTTARAAPPTVVRVPSVEQRQRTIAATLVRTRPRPTAKELSPPTVVLVNPPVETTITAWLVEPRLRREWPRRFPLQGQRQRIVRETGSTVTYQQRDPLLGPRPPQIIDPFPALRAQTIVVWRVEPGNRRSWPRRFPLQGWRQRPIRETGSAAGIGLQGFDPLLGPRPPQIVGPLPTPQQQTIRVALALRRQVEDVRRRARYALRPPTRISPAPAEVAATLVAVRTRRETQRLQPTFRLGEPVFVAATSSIEVVLAGRTRVEAQLRAPHSRLGPPTAVRVPSVEQERRTIRVAVVRARPRPTIGALAPPASVRVAPTREQQTLSATLARTRPRPTVRLLAPPTVVRVPSVEQARRTIAVSLVRARPRPTARRLAPPTVTRTPAVEQALRTLAVALTRTRPRPTVHVLAAPAALRVFEGPRVALVRARPRKTLYRLLAPTVVRVPSIEQLEDTVIVRVVRARPAATRTRLRPPAAVAFGPPPRVRLAPSRRGVPRSTLRPPVPTEPPQRAQTVATSLARIRPAPVRSRLRPPTVVVPFLPPVETTLRVALAAIRPAPTRTRLALPAVVVVPRPGFTTGRVVPGGGGSAETRPGAGGSADVRGGGRSEGSARPGAGTSGGMKPGAATEGDARPGGEPL